MGDNYGKVVLHTPVEEWEEWDEEGGGGGWGYSYDTTRGFLTKLVDSAGGTFTASDDIEGHVLSEGYPNGMTATYMFNQLGVATALWL